jgi:hypothetical protein
MDSYDSLVEKWSPVLNEESSGKIADSHRRSVTAAVLENQEKAMFEQGMMNEVAGNAAGDGTSYTQAGGAGTGAATNWNPILIALVRRAMPNLMAYDVCGVQPMTGPTGLIFAMRSRYKTVNAGAGAVNTEALFNEAQTAYSGDSQAAPTHGAHDGRGPSGLVGAADGLVGGVAGTSSGVTDSNIEDSGSIFVPTVNGGMSTATAEALGTPGGNDFHEMGFTIDKTSVVAKTRALKAEYTLELAQDLKAIHGLDAETELANILSTEILAEINREVIRTINSQAKIGAQQTGIQTRGIFDLATDADGRWSVEKFKGLLVQLERECNVIAKETRRGKGNFIICSSDVATALVAAGMLDYAPALSTSLNVDDTGNTFAGVLNGRTKVYIDPYAVADYVTVGYKGTNPYDAGVFYCPYVPLQMVRAVGENDFQPRIGFKTRYGMVSNPYAEGVQLEGLATARTNQYYRIFRVDNILA